MLNDFDVWRKNRIHDWWKTLEILFEMILDSQKVKISTNHLNKQLSNDIFPLLCKYTAVTKMIQRALQI